MGIPAIILAAGASRRLGQPKQLVRVAGETLLARTIRVVHESGAEPIFVVLGAHEESIRDGVDLSSVIPVANPEWEQGIATSIRAGIDLLDHRQLYATAAMLLVCDQSRLTAEHLRSLITAYEQIAEPAIVASTYAGAVGIPAIFPASQFARLRALEGDTGAKYLLRNSGCLLITKPFEGGEIDIDLPEDLWKNAES